MRVDDHWSEAICWASFTRGAVLFAVVMVVLEVGALGTRVPSSLAADSPKEKPSAQVAGPVTATPTATVEERVTALGDRVERLERRPKDAWDKVEAVSGLVTGLMVGGIVALITLKANNIFRKREQHLQQRRDQREHMVSLRKLKLSEVEILRKYMPALHSKDPDEQLTALSAVGAVDEGLLARFCSYLAASCDEEVVRNAKAILIRQMRSEAKETAVPVVDELRRHNWLNDGSLEGAYLRGANWKGADLRGACLRDADLSDACLARVDLSGAGLERVKFERADLSECRLIDAVLSAAQLRGVNLRGAELKRAVLESADLARANLEEADLQQARLKRTVLRGAILKGASMRGAILGYADLEGANLEGADLEGTVLNNARLLDAIVEPGQVAQAGSLASASLPDGTVLSEDNWRSEFESWREKQQGSENTRDRSGKAR